MKKIFLTILFAPLFCLGNFGYDQLSACEKQAYLWQEIKRTEYDKLPSFEKFGFPQVIKMSLQSMKKKVRPTSDFAPKRWKKYIHRRAAVAKVKFVPNENVSTGVFEGFECGLIRLSLTFDPKKRGVAPGLALKVTRSGMPSANVSALYDLSGQKNNYNFFKNPLSNVVPFGKGLGAKLVRAIFKRVTSRPEEIKLQDLFTYKTDSTKSEMGTEVPRQIFFVPVLKQTFSEAPHDVREDFLSIEKNTALYEVRVLKSTPENFKYSDYKNSMIKDFAAQSVKIGEIITTSEFRASSFGDDSLMFRHEVYSKK